MKRAVAIWVVAALAAIGVMVAVAWPGDGGGRDGGGKTVIEVEHLPRRAAAASPKQPAPTPTVASGDGAQVTYGEHERESRVVPDESRAAASTAPSTTRPPHHAKAPAPSPAKEHEPARQPHSGPCNAAEITYGPWQCEYPTEEVLEENAPAGGKHR